MRQKISRLLRCAALVLGIVLLQIVYSSCKHGLESQHLSGEQEQLAANLMVVTKAYLIDQLGETGFGGKSFCAYKVLDLEQKDDALNEYVYVGCQEYYLKDGLRKKGTGSALPVALVLRKEGSTFKVLSHKIPGDGGQYSRDVERIFPKKTHEEIFAASSNYTSWKNEVESDAKEYFGK
jgi:hypothetical protein